MKELVKFLHLQLTAGIFHIAQIIASLGRFCHFQDIFWQKLTYAKQIFLTDLRKQMFVRSTFFFICDIGFEVKFTNLHSQKMICMEFWDSYSIFWSNEIFGRAIFLWTQWRIRGVHAAVLDVHAPAPFKNQVTFSTEIFFNRVHIAQRTCCQLTNYSFFKKFVAINYDILEIPKWTRTPQSVKS